MRLETLPDTSVDAGEEAGAGGGGLSWGRTGDNWWGWMRWLETLPDTSADSGGPGGGGIGRGRGGHMMGMKAAGRHCPTRVTMKPLPKLPTGIE
jgi:hypothetical protein